MPGNFAEAYRCPVIHDVRNTVMANGLRHEPSIDIFVMQQHMLRLTGESAAVCIYRLCHAASLTSGIPMRSNLSISLRVLSVLSATTSFARRSIDTSARSIDPSARNAFNSITTSPLPSIDFALLLLTIVLGPVYSISGPFSPTMRHPPA